MAVLKIPSLSHREKPVFGVFYSLCDISEILLDTAVDQGLVSYDEARKFLSAAYDMRLKLLQAEEKRLLAEPTFCTCPFCDGPHAPEE